MTYQFAKPDNGEAYTPIELSAIWQIQVTAADYLNGPIAKRWEFFDHQVQQADNWWMTSDKIYRDIITKAILAEVENPPVLFLGDFYKEDDTA